VPDSYFSTDGSLNRVDVPLFPFGSANVTVSAGEQYAIVVEVNSCFSVEGSGCPPESTSAYAWGRTTPSAYSGGNAWSGMATSSGGWAWESQDEYDFAFETFVSPATTAPQDTTPPETAIDTGPSGTVSSTTASFRFSSNESNSTFECKLDDGAFQSCTSPKEYNGLSDGSHTFYVKATDAAGNTDAGPASRAWTVDTKAPKVTSVFPAENATRIGPAVNITATFSEAMEADSINTNTVQLFGADTTTPITAVVGYNGDTQMATLNPDANLQRGTKYKAVVSTDTRDLAGNQLDQDAILSGNQPKEWFFTIRK
jgi:hypothetical protein